MKTVPPDVLKALAQSCGMDHTLLRKMAGGQASSDGVIYREGMGSILMKVMVVPANSELAMLRLMERFQFARMMGQNGVRIIYPQAMEDGSLYQTVDDGDDRYVAYLMEYVTGANIQDRNWSSRFYEDWGQLIGKMHAITQGYPIWQHATVKTSEGEKQIFGWLSEWQSFYDWCQDGDVKKAFLQVREQFEALPVKRDSYGFIHNDPHSNNLLYDGKHLILIDFDVANCHWFMTDIAISLQNTLFKVGGMFEMVKNRGKVMGQLSAFRRGYEQENLLDEFWWQQIDLFIQYRRCMAFTTLYGWLKNDARARNMWKSMIKLNPNVINLPNRRQE